MDTVTRINFQQTLVPIKAFQTNCMKERLEFINVENFNNIMAL